MRRGLFALGVILLWAGLAGAQTTTTSTSTSSSTSTSTSSSTSTSTSTSTTLLSTADLGSFDGPITAPQGTSQHIQVDGRVNLLVYLTGTAGTSAAKCQQSGDQTNWTDVGSATSSALGVVCNVNYPTGFYRVNISSCSASCSLTPKWKAVRLK